VSWTYQEMMTWMGRKLIDVLGGLTEDIASKV
jgi:hypothetical protein